jgi:hypothetical protein
MFRHTVMFRWTPDTTPGDVAAITEGLGGLPGAIPELRAYEFGHDAGINEGNFDFAVVADFADVDDYLAYRDHPLHRAVIAERIAPHVAERAAVQFEIA